LLAIFFPTYVQRILVNLYLCNSTQTLRWETRRSADFGCATRFPTILMGLNGRQL